MREVYRNLMEASREIAKDFPPPKFHLDYAEISDLSQKIYQEDKDVLTCKKLIRDQLEEDLGHGMEHVKKVSLDAGALILIEGKKITGNSAEIRRMAVIAQIAGLLHDIKRKKDNHARLSAKRADELLKHCSISKKERGYVTGAILNHEALVVPRKIPSPIGQMTSDALYDADKFRWGPDNYTSTAWYMLDFSNIPPEKLAERFQREMKGIIQIKIRESFRTETGKKYGPEFIDLGLELGKKIYEHIKKSYNR